MTRLLEDRAPLAGSATHAQREMTSQAPRAVSARAHVTATANKVITKQTQTHKMVRDSRTKRIRGC